jgi:Ca2+-binding EF-hand superfamily protein
VCVCAHVQETSSAAFGALDKDGDGILTKAEYQGGFKLFDKDGDGYISAYGVVNKWNTVIYIYIYI